jgi:hypothetical protein
LVAVFPDAALFPSIVRVLLAKVPPIIRGVVVEVEADKVVNAPVDGVVAPIAVPFIPVAVVLK